MAISPWKGSGSDLPPRLAEYIESEPVRKKAEAEAKKAKLEALEKKLGISKDGESSQDKKRRLDDDEYIEQSKEIVENVKNAVSLGIFLSSQLFLE